MRQPQIVRPMRPWSHIHGCGDIRFQPLLRRVDRHGHIRQQRLSGEALSFVLKERVAAVGLDPTGYLGHSLRAGLATSAAQTGVSSWRVRQQTGHPSEAMLGRYIRDGQLFSDNAAGALI
jgi:hypothetical protein